MDPCTLKMCALFVHELYFNLKKRKEKGKELGENDQ